MNLPLRMVPFEQLMLHLDRPHFPNVLAVRLHFRGEVQAELAQQAFARAVARHPLASAMLDSTRCNFVQADAPLQLAVHPPFGSWPELWQQLDRSRPQTLLESSREVTRLTIASPHALTDGLGGLQFAQDWMTIYHHLLEPRRGLRLPRIEPDRLSRRGDLRWARWSFIRKLPLQAVALFGASKFLLRTPVGLMPGHSARDESAQAEAPLPPEFPGLWHTRIPADLVRQLRHVGRRHQATQHDLLLAALFAAIARWRSTHGGQSPRDWIRLLVPLTTRTREDRALPSCNQVTFVQIDRNPRHIAHLESLAASISRELGVIRRWELDRTLLFALRLAGQIPGGIRRMAQSSKRRATCIATYLGRGFSRLRLPKIPGGYQVGNLQLHDLEMLSPLLPQTPASWAFFEFRGEIIVSLHADLRVLGGDDAQMLLAEFHAALGGLAQLT